MSDPFLGEIRMFAGNYAPVDWNFCDGTLLSIASNDALYTLLGTTYGGDGNVNFALPDLRGRLPLYQGPGFVLGQAGGRETVTLVTAEMPAHSHPFLAASNAGTASSPQNNVPATTSNGNFLYINENTTGPMAANAISMTVGGQSHENFQPYLCVDFIISLFGIFPSPT